MKKITALIKSIFFTLLVFCGLCLISTNLYTTTAYATDEPQVAYSTTAKQQLSEVSQKLYDYMVADIKQIASGSKSDTTVTLNSSTLATMGAKTLWTKEDIGAVYITLDDAFPYFLQQFEVSKVLSAILHDLPYEAYWLDKTTGILQSGGGSENYTHTSVEVTTLTLKLPVSTDYKSFLYNSNNPSVDTAKTSATATALNNAKAIVDTYKNLDDYQKLNAYKNVICDLVSYNNQAATDASIDYGNPWQVIYVFDNNPSTNVVCEGYSKAFQLLCNLSTFSSTHIKCYTVTGTMVGGTGAGPHMWNLVTMDDEQTYLVDITNSDEGSIGQSGKLFLTGTNSGSLLSGYTFYVPSSVKYEYNQNTFTLWGNTASSVLNMASSVYQVNHPTISVNANNVIYKKASITADVVGTLDVDITYCFEDAIDDLLYTWKHEWYSDVSGHMSTKLSSAPTNAGYYWIKVTATNKIDTSIVYIHSERIQIKPKELTLVDITVNGRVYNGTTNVSLSGATITGTLSGDSVSVNIANTTAKISSADVGTYNVVNLSNITLTGASRNNYYINPTLNNMGCNSIEITKANPICTQSYTLVNQEGKTLADIQLNVVAKGALNQSCAGTATWVSVNGESLDPSQITIKKDAKYYYKFTPTSPNYNSVIVEVVLWQDAPAPQSATSKKLPKVIEIAAYGVVALVVLACITSAIKKKKEA